MLRIRLRRMGTNKRPFYRVVVSESGRTPAARVIDTLGHYDPMRKPKAVDLDVARTEAWIAKGARPTGSVLQMLSKERAKASSASA